MKQYKNILAFTVAVIMCSSVRAQVNITPPSLPPDVHEPRTLKDYERLVKEDKYALPWEPIQEKNILFKKRVWRVLDVQEQGNEVFGINQETDDQSRLMNILINGFFEGKYNAYNAVDSRLATKLSREEFTGLLSTGNKHTKGTFNPQICSKIRIIEDWLFLEKEHKMVVRTWCIAPIMQVVNADGTIAEQPAFLLYYPEIRNYLAAHLVYNGKVATGINWDQLFEGRNFKSKIEKVSGYPEPHIPPSE